MSSFLSKIPPELQHVIVDTAKELAGFLWHRITGEHDDSTAASIARQTAEHLAQLAYQEAQIRLGPLALEASLKSLHDRAAEMQPWADAMLAKVTKMTQDDRAAFSTPPLPAFDDSDADTAVGESESNDNTKTSSDR